MNFLLTWIRWGLAALLYLQSAELSKAAPALGDGERKPNEVIKFLEVYERSFCRTIETLVDIFQEYPDEVEYIFKPSCVPLMRCAGCCGDEGLECVPVDVYNVTMEIMRIKPHQSQHISHMSFLQHSKCDCRPKKDVKNKQENTQNRGCQRNCYRHPSKVSWSPLNHRQEVRWMSKAFRLDSPLRDQIFSLVSGVLPSQGRIATCPAAELLELTCPLLGPVLGSVSGQSGFLFSEESPFTQVAFCQLLCTCACHLE
uniref:vascular endothelial growth factor A, long form isoform X1 n=1 Tax=Lonchura striata TaxID=40157 RepID=UPI001087A260|nr:vascular endothelial growth factor A isoform X1 [Lonchura striata domestica]